MRPQRGKKPHSKVKKTSGEPVRGSISLTRKGVGYVTAPGFKMDIEISRNDLNTALHGDIVSVKVRGFSRGRPVGEVTKVEERAKERFVGTLKQEGKDWLLIADDRKMFLPIKVMTGHKECKNDHKAVVHITGWEHSSTPFGALEEILGPRGEHEVEMRAIVREQGFDIGFPAAVEKEAEDLKKRSSHIMEEAIRVRRDFRDTATFTIDPEDAKDFDDALSFKDLGDGSYEIGVHIAHVAHYVTKGSALDREAVRRGTSIYLVDRTIPMLPEVLSNDLCSLNPKEEKLTFSAVFKLDTEGKVLDRWFGETVIRSDKRFTYEEAQKVLDTGNGPFANELKILNAIAKKIRAERERSGAISFDQDEVKFRLDEYGKPLGVYVKQRHDTNLLIEDYMLLANRSVAEYVYSLSKKNAESNLAFVYRIHDTPDPDKITELSIFLKAIGHELTAHDGSITGKDINALFKRIKGTPEENLIKTATIRSMAKAIYSTKNVGHFGLAFKYYTHFTSPIRRYPDLMVHRTLKKHLDGSPIPKQEFAEYEMLAIQSSEREIAAVDAERKSIKYKQVEFLLDKIGQEFDATVSGVTEWGMYVEEKVTKAEGMVSLRAMANDFYVANKKTYSLTGERTGKKYALGDKVRVRLIGASLEERTLDFALA